MPHRECVRPGNGPFVSGIDVSKWQAGIDWNRVKRDHPEIRFCFMRSSVGLGADSRFAFNWQECKRIGNIRGAYHYLKAVRGGEAQAEFMWNQIRESGGYGADLPCVLDLEGDYQTVDGSSHRRTGAAYMDPAKVAEESLAFLRRIEELSGRRPIIYTGQYFNWHIAQKHPDVARQFGRYPLWSPSYTNCVRMSVDREGGLFPWREWAFWQYTSGGEVAGIPGRVDLDYFNGSIAQLRAMAGKESAPERDHC